MPWSSWKLLSNTYLNINETDYQGPGCYQLGIKHEGRKKSIIIYVGKSVNIGKRLLSHAKAKSHLRRKILIRYKNGWSLYGRYWKTNDESLAFTKERKELALYRYLWNKIGMNNKHRLIPGCPP